MQKRPIGNSLLVACLLGILAVPVCARAETVGQFPYLTGKRVEKTRTFTANFERTWDAVLRSIEQDHREWKKREKQISNGKWDLHADKNARLIVLQVSYERKNKPTGPVISTYTFLVEPIDPDHTRVHCHNIHRWRDDSQTGGVGGPYFQVSTPAYFDMAEKALKERRVAK